MLHAPIIASKQRNSATRQSVASQGDAPAQAVPTAGARAYGNQAMLRATSGILQRKCACGGECASCKAEKKKEPHGIQAKLRVNTPGDAFEQEADRVADQVVGPGPGPFAARASAGAVQRKAAGDPAGADVAAAQVTPEYLGPGRPLERSTQSFMEPRFGADFSQVRVHSGTRATAAAESVNALAYTIGHDIVFGAGQYSAGSTGGTGCWRTN